MTPDHLGGHAGITQVDEGALRYAYYVLECRTMLDIGCGPGGQVDLARIVGMSATGIDGDPALNPAPAILHDFTQGPVPEHKLAVEYCLGWSVEFLEHVDSMHSYNYMDAFLRCRWVIITAAPPGATGHHHVNCQPSNYWVSRFAHEGFALAFDETMAIRKASTMGRDFMRDTGLVFRRQF